MCQSCCVPGSILRQDCRIGSNVGGTDSSLLWLFKIIAKSYNILTKLRYTCKDKKKLLIKIDPPLVTAWNSSMLQILNTSFLLLLHDDCVALLYDSELLCPRFHPKTGLSCQWTRIGSNIGGTPTNSSLLCQCTKLFKILTWKNHNFHFLN